MKAKLIFPIAILMIFLLAAAAAEAKSIIKIGDDATVDENQNIDNVVTIGGQITVNGLVENNVVALGGSVVLTGKSVVRGNVVCIGGVVARGGGAQVFGNITEINSFNITAAISSFFRGEPEGWSAVFTIISLCLQFIILILAMLVAFILPRPLTKIKQAIQNNKLKSLLCGLLASLMITPLFIVLVISIIGIYLIPAVFTALLLTFMLGYIATATLLGGFTLSKILPSYKKSLWEQTLLGLILLLVVGWAPYIGWIIKVIAVTVGWGGVLLVLFNRRGRHATI